MMRRSPTSDRATQQGVQHVDSINTSGGSAGGKKKPKSKRPPNSNIRQQRLKAWQPILTAKTVLPLYFAVGVFFLPMGGLLLYASAKVRELSIDYSNCAAKAGDAYVDMPLNRTKKQFRKSNGTEIAQAVQWRRELNTSVYYPDSTVTVDDTAKCFLRFTIEEDLKPPVLFYYRLANLYQNHRSYVISFDGMQLAGQARTTHQILQSDCGNHTRVNGDKVPYYPCGMIANSMFNDTYLMPRRLNSGANDANIPTVYNMTTKGIAWKSERNLYKKTMYRPEDVVPPMNWVRKWDYSKKMPDLSTDERFQSWMRTAGLPYFSKLAMRNDHTIMKKGRYEIEIWDEFNTTLYGGTKEILISTRTAMGGRNSFLGVAYVVVGLMCLVLGAVLTSAHLFLKPRKLGDDKYLSWTKKQSGKARIRA